MMDREQRNNRRLPPTTGRDAAIIRNKGRDEVALIVNLSAQGFRICTHASFPVEVGDVIRLETTDGHHTARVANIEAKEDQLHIGLERVHDAPVENARDQVRRQRRGVRLSRPGMEFGNLISYVLLPIVIGVALLFVIVGWDGIRETLQSLRQLFR
ncbi:MAG: hypothetical protein AB7O26_02195 [Planctomycetaceae bacterium]